MAGFPWVKTFFRFLEIVLETQSGLGSSLLMTNETIQDIRTAAANYGRLATIKLIRLVVVNDLDRAKLIYDDVTSKKSWTKPEIKADTNGSLSCWTYEAMMKKMA